MTPQGALRFNRHTFYAWLDAHGVPFRTSIASLLNDHPAQDSVWPDGAQHLDMPMTPPLMADLAHSPEVRLGRGVADALPPRQMTVSVRAASDARHNIDLGLRGLTAVFGPPTKTQITNAITHEWLDPDDPLCAIKLFGFPDASPDGLSGNERHRRIPATATEASITLSPDYLPAFAPHQIARLSDLTPLLDQTDSALISPAFPWPFYGLSHARPSGADLPQGLWRLGHSDDIAVIGQNGRVILPAPSEIDSIVATTITPARGQGGFSIGLHLDRFGLSCPVGLYSARHNDATGPALAERIAKQMDLDLKTRTWVDD